MNKPQHTYLTIKHRDKLESKAEQAKAMQVDVAARQRAFAERQRADLERILKAKKLDTAKAKRIAEMCRNFGKEPATKQGVLRKALAELVEQLVDTAEQLTKDKELTTEIGAPARTFTAKAKVAPTDAASVLQLVAAVIVFLMAIEKLVAKLKSSAK